MIKTSNGQIVTDEMLCRWCAALDMDEWPAGEYSVGEVVKGRPPMSAEGSAVLSVKVPPAMKRAIEKAAKNEGVTTSDFVRSMLAGGLVLEELRL
jgi:predicted GNAT superfamily acetyltransferase